MFTSSRKIFAISTRNIWCMQQLQSAAAPRTDHLVEICGGRCLKNGLYSGLPAYLQMQQPVAHTQACVVQIRAYTQIHITQVQLHKYKHKDMHTNVKKFATMFVNATLGTQQSPIAMYNCKHKIANTQLHTCKKHRCTKVDTFTLAGCCTTTVNNIPAMKEQGTWVSYILREKGKTLARISEQMSSSWSCWCWLSKPNTSNKQNTKQTKYRWQRKYQTIITNTYDKANTKP